MRERGREGEKKAEAAVKSKEKIRNQSIKGRRTEGEKA